MFARPDACWLVDGVLFIGCGTLLPPREGRVLSHLALHKGEVCTKADLYDAAWESPDNWPQWAEHDLTAFICRVRKALPRRLAFIETILEPHGKGNALVGYRLTGSIGVKEVKGE